MYIFIHFNVLNIFKNNFKGLKIFKLLTIQQYCFFVYTY